MAFVVAQYHNILQSFEGIQSPNDMQIDGDEYVIEPPESEKDDVTIITPDEFSGDSAEQLPQLPLADDSMLYVLTSSSACIS